MNIVDAATSRYTTKAFDPKREISSELMARVHALLRNSASSVNSQPWHFLVAHSEQAKSRIAQATLPGYAYNESKILHASHVIVFCARKDMDEQHLQALLAQEDRDGRFADATARQRQDASRRFYVDLNRQSRLGLDAWIDKQIYLNLGTLLLGASALGIDACPMEGADFQKIDAEFGLDAQNLRSVVIASLGYRSDDDFNAQLPKSRLPEADIIHTL